MIEHSQFSVSAGKECYSNYLIPAMIDKFLTTTKQHRKIAMFMIPINNLQYQEITMGS